MAAVGMTFSPINAPQGPGAGASPLQDAIKLLSFKLPQVVGANAPSGVLGPPTLAGGLGPSQGTGGMNTFLMQLLQGLVPDAGGSDAPVMGQPPRPAVQFPQATPPQVPPMGGGPMPSLPRPDLQFPEGFRFGG